MKTINLKTLILYILLSCFVFLHTSNCIATNILNIGFNSICIPQNLNNINLNFSDDLYEYDGTIEHLSFNTLMAFPDKALDKNNALKTTYDETKITTTEFKNILQSLYQNNYVLVDIYDVFNSSNFEKQSLHLQKNKKPIILSFDNVTYKSNYQNLGEIDKIIIDRNNQLATYTTKKSIQDRIQYNNEFVVILENFIKAHPDFSHNHARGIIFFSGENGVLGYTTKSNNASSKQDSKRAYEVITKLKHLGWKFGCNNYTYTDDNLKSNIDFIKELSLWNKEIKPLINDTPLYAFPLGNPINENTDKYNILLDNNFKLFFKYYLQNSTSPSPCDRKHVNGHALRNNPELFEGLFNPQDVYDYQYRDIEITKKSTKLT